MQILQKQKKDSNQLEINRQHIDNIFRGKHIAKIPQINWDSTVDATLPSELKHQRLKKGPTDHLKQVQKQPCSSLISIPALPERSVKTCQSLSCSQHEEF